MPDRPQLRVKAETYSRLKELAAERKRTLLQTLEEVVDRGLRDEERTSAILGEGLLLVVTYAHMRGWPIEKAHAYMLKVATGRLKALRTYKGRRKKTRRRR